MTCHCRGQSSASDWFVQREKFASTNQKHYSDLGSNTSSVWNFAHVTRTSFRGKASGRVVKSQLFCQVSIACQVTLTTSESSQHLTRHWIVCWSSLTMDLIFLLQTGDSVMVAGQKTGTVRFVGRTQFASGWALANSTWGKDILPSPSPLRTILRPVPFLSSLCKPDQLVNSHHPDDKLVNLPSLKVMRQKPAYL